MNEKEKQNISMREMLTKRSFEPITNCNCKVESRIDYAVRKNEDNTGLMVDLLNQEIEELKKAKAIVEMQNVVCERLCNQDCRKCNYYNKNNCIQKDNVDLLYEQGYRKLPEDSVVLTREEYEKLKYQWVTDSDAYKKGGKETAEKILFDLVGHTFEDDGWTYTVDVDDVKWLADKYNVEIKE